MIDAKALLSDLQKLLKVLEDDIRRRCEMQPEVNKPLQAQYAAAKDHNRTAQAYEVWRDEQITQAAVAWILGCVFVRFCEDNRLIDPPRLSGPGDRRKRAEDEHTLYFQQHPTLSDREYLQWVFEQVAQLPAMKELFDKRHNPLWLLGVSGDGAMALRDFWLRRDAATGLLVHDFTTEVASDQLPVASKAAACTGNWQPITGNSSPDPTRFLGDLYQDLSESVREVRPAPDADLRRGVHPRPYARAGHPRVRLPTGADDRPDLRLRPLPAGWIPPAVRPVGEARAEDECPPARPERVEPGVRR